MSHAPQQIIEMMKSPVTETATQKVKHNTDKLSKLLRLFGELSRLLILLGENKNNLNYTVELLATLSIKSSEILEYTAIFSKTEPENSNIIDISTIAHKIYEATKGVISYLKPENRKDITQESITKISDKLNHELPEIQRIVSNINNRSLFNKLRFFVSILNLLPISNFLLQPIKYLLKTTAPEEEKTDSRVPEEQPQITTEDRSQSTIVTTSTTYSTKPKYLLQEAGKSAMSTFIDILFR